MAGGGEWMDRQYPQGLTPFPVARLFAQPPSHTKLIHPSCVGHPRCIFWDTTEYIRRALSMARNLKDKLDDYDEIQAI